jgi:hypothetical protein
LTTRASQPLQLVFGDHRPDLRNVPNLVSQWFGIRTNQCFATPPTGLGFEPNDFLALFGWNQRSLVLGMTRLAAPFFPGSFLLVVSRGLGVRMFAAWRQRRIARRLLSSRQLGF